MLTKGGLNAITVSLASEYAKNNIRFNAVAPGAVDTPLVKAIPKDFPPVNSKSTPQRPEAFH